MNKLVAFFLGIGVIAAAFAGLVLAAVLGTLTAITLMVMRMTGRLQPAMARASRARPQAAQGADAPRDFRVWNDGRGTIIDM